MEKTLNTYEYSLDGTANRMVDISTTGTYVSIQQEIDRDRQELLAVLDELDVIPHVTREYKRQLLDKLLHYTSHHFHRERDMMLISGYDFFTRAQHNSDHSRLLKISPNLLHKFIKQNGETLSTEIVEIKRQIREAFLLHFEQFDMKLLQYLRNKPLQ